MLKQQTGCPIIRPEAFLAQTMKKSDRFSASSNFEQPRLSYVLHTCLGDHSFKSAFLQRTWFNHSVIEKKPHDIVVKLQHSRNFSPLCLFSLAFFSRLTHSGLSGPTGMAMRAFPACIGQHYCSIWQQDWSARFSDIGGERLRKTVMYWLGFWGC